MNNSCKDIKHIKEFTQRQLEYSRFVLDSMLSDYFLLKMPNEEGGEVSQQLKKSISMDKPSLILNCLQTSVAPVLCDTIDFLHSSSYGCSV